MTFFITSSHDFAKDLFLFYLFLRLLFLVLLFLCLPMSSFGSFGPPGAIGFLRWYFSSSSSAFVIAPCGSQVNSSSLPSYPLHFTKYSSFRSCPFFFGIQSELVISSTSYSFKSNFVSTGPGGSIVLPSIFDGFGEGSSKSTWNTSCIRMVSGSSSLYAQSDIFSLIG